MRPAPQLEFYAADRGGRTAVIETRSGRIVAWIEILSDSCMRARANEWVSPVVPTVTEAISEFRTEWIRREER